jgi:UDP-N-acetylmuramate dehydrogenase
MLAGIPATIGGTLVMNAGCYGGEIGTHISEVLVIRNEKIISLTKEQCGFTYRNSNLKDTIILEGSFVLPKADPVETARKRKELMLARNEAQPVEIPNAGCVFKNPSGTFAAKLIDECGLKGIAIGGAMVSHKHANFIVNIENATAHDVTELIRVIRKRVKERTGIELELELKLVGFEKVLI